MTQDRVSLPTGAGAVAHSTDDDLSTRPQTTTTGTAGTSSSYSSGTSTGGDYQSSNDRSGDYQPEGRELHERSADAGRGQPVEGGPRPRVEGELDPGQPARHPCSS